MELDDTRAVQGFGLEYLRATGADKQRVGVPWYIIDDELVV